MSDVYKKVNKFLDTDKTPEGFYQFALTSLTPSELRELLCTQDGIGKEKKEALVDAIYEGMRHE